MNSYILFKRGILVALVAIFFAGGVGMFDSVRSANLSDVTVTLSTPRLSFHGILGSGNAVGSTVVTLANTGAPSTGTYNLFVGETVDIGNNTKEVVVDVNDGLTFQIENGLATGDADEGDLVYVARPTDITIDFTTVSAINGGKYRVLVPAAADNNNDGIPDEDGWDGGTTAALGGVTVTCPDAAVAVKTPGLDVDGVIYHSFVCPTTGINTPGAKQIVIEDLINPTPNADSPAHEVGVADQYRIVVEHLNSSDAVVDRTVAAVALIEAVRITASVAPSIELELLPVTASSAVCDIASTSVATTATQVPLGELQISAFRTAAQKIKVSTNASGGYVVTGIAEDQLRRQHVATCASGGTADLGCIPDSVGDGSSMTKDDSDEWSSTDTKGFAYSLEDVTSGGVGTPTMSFETGSNSQYRQFADAQELEDPVILFSSDTVADSHLVNVCYKAVISATQEAGEDYATNVTYRATATF